MALDLGRLSPSASPGPLCSCFHGVVCLSSLVIWKEAWTLDDGLEGGQALQRLRNGGLIAASRFPPLGVCEASEVVVHLVRGQLPKLVALHELSQNGVWSFAHALPRSRSASPRRLLPRLHLPFLVLAAQVLHILGVERRHAGHGTAAEIVPLHVPSTDDAHGQQLARGRALQREHGDQAAGDRAGRRILDSLVFQLRVPVHRADLARQLRMEAVQLLAELGRLQLLGEGVRGLLQSSATAFHRRERQEIYVVLGESRDVLGHADQVPGGALVVAGLAELLDQQVGVQQLEADSELSGDRDTFVLQGPDGGVEDLVRRPIVPGVLLLRGDGRGGLRRLRIAPQRHLQLVEVANVLGQAILLAGDEVDELSRERVIPGSPHDVDGVVDLRVTAAQEQGERAGVETGEAIEVRGLGKVLLLLVVLRHLRRVARVQVLSEVLGQHVELVLLPGVLEGLSHMVGHQQELDDAVHVAVLSAVLGDHLCAAGAVLSTHQLEGVLGRLERPQQQSHHCVHVASSLISLQGLLEAAVLLAGRGVLLLQVQQLDVRHDALGTGQVAESAHVQSGGVFLKPPKLVERRCLRQVRLAGVFLENPRAFATQLRVAGRSRQAKAAW
eukprot:scaffold535_cov260-Pinguiococcus_pyrenoidosus.AAC.34